MKVAAIDIGTNSVKLLVAEHDGERLKPLLERVEITRLGEGLGTKNRIALEAADRTLETLAEYKRIADEQAVERLDAVGTRALRAAKNAKDFLLRCEYEAGFRPRVIPAREEARLAFRGAFAAARRTRAIVLDIGGGSAQLTLGGRRRINWHWSMPAGAVVLTERHLRSDPPRTEELESLRKEVRDRLVRPAALLRDKAALNLLELIGVGGTVTTAAAIALRMARLDPEKLHRQRLSLGTVEALLSRLASISLGKRKDVTGLDPARADIIVAGLSVLTEAMTALGFETLRVSTWGLRHGLALELARGRR